MLQLFYSYHWADLFMMSWVMKCALPERQGINHGKPDQQTQTLITWLRRVAFRKPK